MFDFDTPIHHDGKSPGFRDRGVALLLAVVLNQKLLRARGLFRTVYYFPSITSSVVISLIFMWMFSRSGIVNVALSGLFPNYEPVTWLNDSNGLIHNVLGVFGITRQTAGDWAGARIAGLTAWEWISGPSVTAESTQRPVITMSAPSSSARAIGIPPR